METPAARERRLQRRSSLWEFSDEDLVDELLERGYSEVRCSVIVKTDVRPAGRRVSD